MSVTRGKVQEHISQLSAYTMDAITHAIARLDFDDAATRLFARAASGLEVPPAAVAATIPHMRDPVVVIELIRQCDGDRVEMLVELLEHTAFAPDEVGVQLIALVLGAMVKLGLGQHRARAILQARVFVVQFLYDRRAALAYPAIMTLEAMYQDRYLSAMVAPLRSKIPSHMVVDAPRDLLTLWSRLDRPKDAATVLDDLFPALPVITLPPRTTAEMLRQAARNKPCPCGSGKKFKVCHGPQVEQMMATDPRLNPAPVPTTISRASLRELAERGPKPLNDASLVAALDRLVEASQWEMAETFLAELDTRASLAEKRDGWRFQVILRAFSGQRPDVVKRQAPAVRSEKLTRTIAPGLIGIAVAERAPDALDRLLRGAEDAASDPTGGAAIDFASAMSQIAPALGLLLLRGCMYLPQAYLGQNALSLVDMASARVGVLVGDSIESEPARVLVQAMQAAATKQAEDTERKRLQGVAEHLRTELAASNQRTKELERQLEHARDELRARPAPVEAAPAEPAELRRFRDKVDELQSC